MSEQDELQSVEPELDQGEIEQESADLDEHEDSDSATEREPEHEENAEGDAKEKPVNQDAINEAINKQHAKYREEQRRRQQLEKELEELRGKGQSYDPEPRIAEVDPYADDVEEQIRRRDESIRKHLAWQQRQEQNRQRSYSYEQQRQAEEQQRAQESEQRFFETAKSMKIDQQALDKAVQTVGQYQLGPQVANYLLSDDKGPAVTTALAKNPALLAELSLMQPHEAILHIERNVRSRLNIQPRTSQGKQPPTRVKGRASDVSDKFPLTGGRVKIE